MISEHICEHTALLTGRKYSSPLLVTIALFLSATLLAGSWRYLNFRSRSLCAPAKLRLLPLHRHVFSVYVDQGQQSCAIVSFNSFLICPSLNPSLPERRASPFTLRGTSARTLVRTTRLITPQAMDPRLPSFVYYSALGLSHGHSNRPIRRT